MKRYLILFAIIVMIQRTQAQYEIERLEPPFWWAGMKNTELQLLVYGEQVSGLEPEIDAPGIEIEDIVRVENQNYLFVNLNIGDADPGSFNISFRKDGKTKIVYRYELYARKKNSSVRRGVNNSDIIYLITPDRFANGNPANDNVERYTDK
jgi:hypothetical protein